MRRLIPPPFNKNPKAAPMAPPLTIRNLTSVPIDLKVIERYNAPREGGEPLRAVSRFAGNITSFTNNITETIGVKLPTGPASKELAENAQSFNHEEVQIRIDPFTTNRTD